MKKLITAAATAAALSLAPVYAATADTPMSGTTKPTGTSQSITGDTNVNHGAGSATDNVTKQTPSDAQAATAADANASMDAKPKKEGFFSRLFHRGDKSASTTTTESNRDAAGTTRGPNDAGR